jgi:hypothetical protein
MLPQYCVRRRRDGVNTRQQTFPRRASQYRNISVYSALSFATRLDAT